MHLLKNINKTILFTTSSAPANMLINNFGNAVNRTIIKRAFAAIGFNNSKWYNLGLIQSSSEKEREDFLNNISNHI